MRKTFFNSLLFSVLCVSPLFAQNAEIKIDIDRTIETVNKNHYRNFTDHLGRCIYGDVYDEGSKLSIRMDTASDWENGTLTIVFTGLNNKGIEVWGKKVQTQ